MLAPLGGCDNRRMPERLEVQRAVAASAGEIFAVLTDPGGHVAIDSSGMLMEASGDIVAKVGDTFVVHMDREALNDYPLGLYDVTVEIVTFALDQEIAWTVGPGHGSSAARGWSPRRPGSDEPSPLEQLLAVELLGQLLAGEVPLVDAVARAVVEDPLLPLFGADPRAEGGIHHH